MVSRSTDERTNLILARTAGTRRGRSPTRREDELAREGDGAEHVGPCAEPGRDHLDALGRPREGPPLERRLQRADEQLPRLGELAADDDPGRGEDAAEPAEGPP